MECGLCALDFPPNFTHVYASLGVNSCAERCSKARNEWLPSGLYSVESRLSTPLELLLEVFRFGSRLNEQFQKILGLFGIQKVGNRRGAFSMRVWVGVSPEGKLSNLEPEFVLLLNW